MGGPRLNVRRKVSCPCGGCAVEGSRADIVRRLGLICPCGAVLRELDVRPGNAPFAFVTPPPPKVG